MSRLEKGIPSSVYSVKGPLFMLILSSMMFRKIYHSWDRIVKGPQINDSVLGHNNQCMRPQISSSPATCKLCEIFLPQLGPSLVDVPNHLIQIDLISSERKINRPKVGTNCVDFLLPLSEY